MEGSCNSSTETIYEAASSEVTFTNTEVEFNESMKDATQLLKMYCGNRIQEFQQALKTKIEKTLYHTWLWAAMSFIDVLASFDMEVVEACETIVKKGLDYVDSRRRKNNALMGMIKTPDYDTYSDEELHTELCYAELSIIKCLVTYFGDSSIVNLVKLGNASRATYVTINNFQHVLDNRSQWTSPQSKNQFASAILNLLGVINLYSSLIPKRILKMLKFMGFPCDKSLGREQLEEACRLEGGLTLRGAIALMNFLNYHVYSSSLLGVENAHSDLCESLIEVHQKSYPKSRVFQHYTGKIHMTKGNIKEAIECLENIKYETWMQFRFMAQWELIWCYVLTDDLDKASSCVQYLKEKSNWSKALLTYIQGVIAFTKTNKQQAIPQQITDTFRKVPGLKKRIASHTYFMTEKFFCHKATRYTDEGDFLFLPLEEMAYIWNYFYMLKGNDELLHNKLRKIENSLEELSQNSSESPYYMDDWCLGVFLKGCCLRMLKAPYSAEECFNTICQNESKLKEDFHLVAWSLVELGFLHIELNNYAYAETLLKTAKKYKIKIKMGDRVQFKIQAGLIEIKEKWHSDDHLD